MKNLKNQILFLVLIMILFTACTGENEKKVSLDTKIGQMIMIGFRGTEIDSNSKIAKDIKKYNPGGIILFDYDVPSKSRPRNIISKSQLASLVDKVQELSDIPAFISIDQEGGKVSRLKERYGFPSSESAEHIGLINNVDTSVYWSSRTATTLQSVNINMNFAPVVDVNINPDCPVIGKLERSFSANPEIVSAQAKIVIDEHRKKDIICALKHFPGHGSAHSDSHAGFTDVSETWQESELIPYKELIASGDCDMIMTAHVFNSNLDSLYPATLSKNVVSTLLRDSLGFAGLIISDDMNMGAIANNYSMSFAIERAINAGIDIILFSNNSNTYDPEMPDEIFTIIKKLVTSGKISEERIDESYERIMKMKKKYHITE